MSRRTKLALIILVAVLLLALGLYLILSQLLGTPPGAAPAAPTPTAPYIAPSVPAAPASGGTTTGTSPVAAVSDAIRLLENRSRSVVERIGSGASTNGFLGYQDVLVEFTPAGRDALLAEQRALQTAHPVTGPAYGISTRAAAARASSGASGDARIVLTVEAVQNIDAGDPSRPTERIAKRADVTFVRQADGGYLIDRLVWSDLQL